MYTIIIVVIILIFVLIFLSQVAVTVSCVERSILLCVGVRTHISRSLDVTLSATLAEVGASRNRGHHVEVR